MQRHSGIHAVTGALLSLIAAPSTGQGQAPIQDNSFLVEEAYNQERGVVQHVSLFERTEAGAWGYGFTQEWSLGGIRHQLGYTLELVNAGDGAGVGDIGLNYRMQVMGNPEASLLAAPRMTLLLPTGSEDRGRGTGGVGLQVNLPVSVVLSPRVVTHWNAGTTLTPAAAAPAGGSAFTRSFNLGAGAVWLLRRDLNFLLEAVWTSDAVPAADGVTARGESAYLSPGIRWAHQVGGVQLVPGVAYAVGIGPARGTESLLLYLSIKHAFSR